MIHERENCTVLAADLPSVPNQDTGTISAEELLCFVQHTSFEVLAPVFRVSGSSVTYTISELFALYQEMVDRGESYLQYLNAAKQEEPDHGSS